MKPDIDRATLSRRVRGWLEGQKLTVRSASAAYVGLNPAMISRGLNGHVLSAASLLALCRAMDMDPRDFLIFVDPRREFGQHLGQQNQAVTAIGKRETQKQSEGIAT